MNLPVKDMLYGALEAPPHPAPVAAVHRRLRRRSRALALTAACSTVALLGVGVVASQVLHDRERPAEFARSAHTSELGTIKTPGHYRETLIAQGDAAPNRLDLLARYTAGSVTYFVAGNVAGDRFCVTTYTTVFDDGDAVACGPQTDWANHTGVVVRLSSSDTGGATKYRLSGTAPEGTREIRVSGPGHRTILDRVYDSGDSWAHRVYFHMPWYESTAVVTALDASGHPLGAVTVAADAGAATGTH